MMEELGKPAASAVQGYILANLILNLSLSVSMALMWSMINTL